MNKSVIIIGGGLGGLFTGAILSKEGLSVTIIEKNAIIGGGLQSFKRFGEVFDTGMHLIGGMQKDGNIRRICEYLGIWDKVHVKDTDHHNSDCIFFSEDKRTYHLCMGRTHLMESLSTDFPDQRENLSAYFEALYKVADEVDLFYLRPSTDYMQVHSDDFQISADSFIKKYITDEHLQSILAYLSPLYGGREGITPAYVHALISVLYIDGSSRFAGGSLLFAEALRDYIITNGGRIITGDAVASVHNKGKELSGVTTISGKSFFADYYVSAIHPCTLFSLLDDETILPRPYRERLNALPNSYSAFTLNIKLRQNSFKFFNYTQFYITKYEDIWSIGETEKWPCGFLCVTPPEIDQGEYANKIIVTAPMAWSIASKWSNSRTGDRGEEYEKWKIECTDKLLDCMEEVFPHFRDCIDAINSASPLTIRDYYGVKEGSMYGFSKDCNNPLLSQVPVVTKVPNLFLTGQNCNLHGFCGVALTAINTCEAILGRNFILNKINRFNDIRPYYTSEVYQVMQRVSQNPILDNVMGFLYPNADLSHIRKQLAGIVTIKEFQEQVMYPAIGKIIEKTSSAFTYDGVDNISPMTNYLYVSNHRDIMLDASLLSYVLISNSFDTCEISFGANLMQCDFVVDIGKMNKMFRVERPGGDIREFYSAMAHLSDYIRTTIRQRHQSIWIAQRNGRTKDGEDRTDHGIIKMFSISCPKDNIKAIADLNIIPVAISYEWEPCDILKAIELKKRSLGPYKKKPGEDLNSILSGVMQQKGKIHISICERITEDDLRPFETMSNNLFYKSVADLIDQRICSAYKLFPNNYIAHDILHNSNSFEQHYSHAGREKFESYLTEQLKTISCDEYADIRNLLLSIYSNPVDSKSIFSG